MTYTALITVGIIVFIAWIVWELVHAPLIKDFPLLGLDIDDVNEDKNRKNKEAEEK